MDKLINDSKTAHIGLEIRLMNNMIGVSIKFIENIGTLKCILDMDHFEEMLYAFNTRYIFDEYPSLQLHVRLNETIKNAINFNDAIIVKDNIVTIDINHNVFPCMWKVNLGEIKYVSSQFIVYYKVNN